MPIPHLTFEVPPGTFGPPTVTGDGATASTATSGAPAGPVPCTRCGRPLTDPDSIARRIGPTCAKKVGEGLADVAAERATGGERLDSPTERIIRCLTCDATTEDVLRAAPGATVETWCHRCDATTRQEVIR